MKLSFRCRNWSNQTRCNVGRISTDCDPSARILGDKGSRCKDSRSSCGARPWRPGVPIPHTPEVALLFLAVGPLPLAPLWENFYGHADHNSIYVHSLPGYDPDAAPSLVFFGRHLSSQFNPLATSQHLDAKLSW